LKKKFYLILQILFINFICTGISLSDFQKKLVDKLETTKTLSFNFRQTIAEREEIGKCYIKYPLLMKCDYEGFKKKSIISNGRTVAIIKKKYKKIYYYPIKTTPLFTILKKKQILDLVKNNKPKKISSNLIEYELIGKKSNIIKIFFDKNLLEFKGWETNDAYSNKVIFLISNLKTNIIINSDFFKIPREKDL
jgi:outer membrane lipoprotein-sorting protein